MSGSIKGSLENVVKGKLVLKGGKGVGGSASASSSLSKTAGVSKEVSEAPKQQSSSPKVYDTRTPYEKKVADARNKRELEQLRSVSAKSHKQRLEEFNAKLSSLPEINEIPNVAGGG